MNILIINGPNIDMLEYRSKKEYGNLSYKQICDYIEDSFLKVNFTFFQSNSEQEIIEYLHKIVKGDIKFDSLIINPAAFTHTSLAIADALEMISIPKIEVHLSDIDNRESFRKINYFTSVTNQVFMGKQIESYIDAIEYLIK